MNDSLSRTLLRCPPKLNDYCWRCVFTEYLDADAVDSTDGDEARLKRLLPPRRWRGALDVDRTRCAPHDAERALWRGGLVARWPRRSTGAIFVLLQCSEARSPVSPLSFHSR